MSNMRPQGNGPDGTAVLKRLGGTSSLTYAIRYAVPPSASAITCASSRHPRSRKDACGR